MLSVRVSVNQLEWILDRFFFPSDAHKRMSEQLRKVLEDPSSSSQEDRRFSSQENSVSLRLLNPISIDSRRKERSSPMVSVLKLLENTDHLADSHSSRIDTLIIAKYSLLI